MDEQHSCSQVNNTQFVKARVQPGSMSPVVSSNITVKCLDIKRGKPASAHVTLDRAKRRRARFFRAFIIIKNLKCLSF